MEGVDRLGVALLQSHVLLELLELLRQVALDVVDRLQDGEHAEPHRGILRRGVAELELPVDVGNAVALGLLDFDEVVRAVHAADVDLPRRLAHLDVGVAEELRKRIDGERQLAGRADALRCV